MKLLNFPILVILLALVIAGCSTSTQVINTVSAPESTSVADSLLAGGDYITMDYGSIRAKMDDPLRSVSNAFPEDYKFVTSGNTSQRSRQGFRVQLISTQNREDAEIMLESYKIWLASQRFDHNPKGYILFRAPFFRVHIGDYYERPMAMDLVQRMKAQFPDAWVVADTIDPEEASKY